MKKDNSKEERKRNGMKMWRRNEKWKKKDAGQKKTRREAKKGWKM